MWAWGSSNWGQLGDGTNVNKSSPVQIGALADWSKVFAGLWHSFAMKTDGTIWTWGFNSSGQLGTGVYSLAQVVPAGGWNDFGYSCSALGLHAIKTNGTLWAWGPNNNGELGDGTALNKISPVQIGALTNWSDVVDGKFHAAALRTDGTIWVWGLNTGGQIADGTLVSKSSPVQLGTGTGWVKIVAGQSNTYALKNDGTVWGGGDNTAGQLCVGATSSPVQVGALTDWSKIAAGNSHFIAIKTDGTLWAWGLSANGQLGDGQIAVNRSSPVQIGTLTDWLSVYSGNFVSYAIKTDGTLWAWGYANVGQVGDGQIATSRSSPVQIGNLTNWINSTAVVKGGGAASHIVMIK